MSDGDTTVPVTEQPAAPSTYQPKTDDEVRQIARDLVAGKIFTDRHIRDGEFEDMVGSIFMVIGLGGQAVFSGIGAANIGMVYEYLDKAGPRSVNGYPSFFSVQMLNKADTKRVFACAEAIEAAVKNVPVPP